MEFKKVISIEGIEKIYCTDPSYLVFFNLKDERYFLYSLCTDDSLDSCSLTELNLDDYKQIKDSNSSYSEIRIEAFETLLNSIIKAKIENEENFTTLGDVLKLK